MLDKNKIKKTKEKVSFIINSLIEMIKNPNLPVNKSAYFYHQSEKNNFIIYIYLFKLLINEPDYLEKKYKNYLNHFTIENPNNISKITDIKANNELELLLIIREKIKQLDYIYNESEEKIYFIDNTYVNSRWLISFISLILDNTKNYDSKEINICYTIANKEITKLVDSSNIESFLSKFTYYSIRVKRTDKTRQVRENNILIVKNAAINYLKHLKQYKHGLENEESYLIFYNLLKSECNKEGFELEEEEKNILEIEPKELDKIYQYIDEDFYKQQLSKQVHIIENIVWQSSNDLTLLEHMNTSIDSLIDFFSIIKIEPNNTYIQIKKNHTINDIKLLLILTINQFLLTYLSELDEIDYSLIDLTSVHPQYMNRIYKTEEQDIKNRLNSYNQELTTAKRKLEENKNERAILNKDELGPEKYQKELERCVSQINRNSIIIARLNSTISSLTREYEELKKIQSEKYRNIELYNYNHSIIRHLCNSTIGCNYYMKTNNTNSIFSNIIIFEDYEKTDNSFYLEISIKELLKISNHFILNGIIEQNDLPKLA